MERSRCKCGKVKSKWTHECKACHKATMDKAYAAAQVIVDKNECPVCGRPLRHNTSILGWYQCAQFGAPGFRINPDQEPCNFQTFIRWER